MTKKAIVVGAGFAGLAAACVLAQQGISVTVHERNTVLGGRARAFEAEGFHFDMGPSWYWMPDVFESFFGHFGKSVSDYYDLRRLDPAFRVFFVDDDVVDVPSSMEGIYELFDNIEPGSGARLRKFLREGAVKYQIGMQRLVYKPSRSLMEFNEPAFLWRLLSMHVFRSYHNYVRKYFTDPRLLRILEFPVLFLGGTPKATPALYSLMNYAGLELGTWYPMGGMSQIVAALASLATSLGVKFKTDSEVESIVVSDGIASGIQFNGSFETADTVVAGADYHHVEQRLLASEFRKYGAKYWDSRVLAPSCLVFYLGVDRRLDHLSHHNLFFDEDFNRHMLEIYSEPRWPSNPLFYVCCPSKTDPVVAPDGCENLFVLIPIAAGLEDTEALREKYFDLVMHRLEKRISQPIRPHVVFKRAYSVRDFERDYNALKGNAYGLASTLRQTALLRPSMHSSRVKNLFFSGQLTVPGPGVPPSLISGQVAANEALNYLRGT